MGLDISWMLNASDASACLCVGVPNSLALNFYIACFEPFKKRKKKEKEKKCADVPFKAGWRANGPILYASCCSH